MGVGPQFYFINRGTGREGREKAKESESIFAVKYYLFMLTNHSALHSSITILNDTR